MGAMREIVSEPRQYYCGMMKLSACRSVRTQRSSSDFFACSPILFLRLGLDGVRAVLHATTQRMAREFPWPVAGPGVYSLWPIQRDARRWRSGEPFHDQAQEDCTCSECPRRCTGRMHKDVHDRPIHCLMCQTLVGNTMSTELLRQTQTRSSLDRSAARMTISQQPPMPQQTIQ